ncbi:hypothetical protein [Halobaculum rubrum]|uniref:hypothetical protein n=1 Tax=Halobaculum rubrum TaxID=2872158 RepID=UPI001CA420A2|nr:hypothetical protein [Halobaculum rubrum]QZY01150.1 hypothetical protein K6T25_15285 [Halobaculum rubrum]
MATAQNVTVDSESNEVHIDSLTVHDEELASFLSDAPGEPEAAVERALRVGASTLELADTTREVEYVRREFDTLREAFADEVAEVEREFEDAFGDDGEFEGRLDDAFGEGGAFADRLDEQFGEEGEVIQQALDPDNDGSPLNRIRQTFREEIRELSEKLERQAGAEEERELSHRSGYDFEDDVEELLADATYNTSDDVERTAETEGELPGRDVGDFVYTIGETGQRIAVEAKSVEGYTRPKIDEEMADAIENRDADFGVFVSECESFVPDTVGYFQPYDDYVCVSLSADRDDEVDESFLRIALSWARTRAIQRHVDAGDDLDPEEVQSRVEAVRDELDRISNAKRKCTEMQSTADDVKGLLDGLRDDVIVELDGITTELSKASDGA